jgi:hypothetical protein
MRWLPYILFCLPCYAAPIVVQNMLIGPVIPGALYTEYYILTPLGEAPTNGRSFVHCCPNEAVQVSFNTVTGKTYIVELRDTTGPVRLEYNRVTGELIGVSSVDLTTNSYNRVVFTNLNSSWHQVSPILAGNGSNLTFVFNTIHTQAFVRVKQL